MGGEGARRTGSSASGRRGVGEGLGEGVCFGLLRGKRGKLGKNLRFAMGVGLGGDIFLRFGGKDGGYWVVRGLSLPYPVLNVSYELVGNYHGFPAQSRVRIYTKLDIFDENWD